MEIAVDTFSRLALSMRGFEQEVEFKKLSQKNPAFSKEDSTDEKRAERKLKSKDDYWFFDKTYFSEEMYSDGYSEPSDYHKFLVADSEIPGISINAGPRKTGKTATMKKAFVWKLLTGRISFGGTLSSTLPTSRNILADIVELLATDRIAFDYAPELIEANKDQFTMRIMELPNLTRCIALSEGRSARGATLLFARPKFILCDDLETRQSPLGSQQVYDRIKIIQETFQSMSIGGTLMVLGNNFDVKCALNKLITEHSEGLLPEFYRVNVTKAWDNDKSVWQSRYPAKSEDEMKRMLNVTDIIEWLGEYQQTPTPPDGIIFMRLSPLPYYTDLPMDAKGVLWCDPNLAKKSKGDFTSITKYLYSPGTDFYYLAAYICRSYSDPNDLLNDYLRMKDGRVRACGFDGNVSQESNWSSHVKNWCRIYQQPFPTIFYKRYNVDELAKNAQAAWNAGKIMLPDGMYLTKEGKIYLDQCFSFAGKKAGNPDDAPDGLISAHELIHERHLAKRISSNAVSIVKDFFNF